MKFKRFENRPVVNFGREGEVMMDQLKQMNEGNASAMVETVDASAETPQAAVEEGDRQQTHEKDADVTIDIPKATGPRTVRGKNRSRRNAVRHGIFTKALPLEGDALAEFQALLAGLEESLQPVGPTEDLIVEELTILNWRKRQLFIAHQAEVRKSQEFIQWDRKQELEREAEEQASKTTKVVETPGNRERFLRVGMVWHTNNPTIMDACIGRLKNVVELIESDERWWDSTDIFMHQRAIYGDSEMEHPNQTFNDTYEMCCDAARVSAGQPGQQCNVTTEQCKAAVVEAITEEIARLEQCKNEALKMETRHTELEILRRGVPEGPALDRLMRYEAHLSRIEDRKLTQLERLQRMRLGQPVLPPVKVEVSQN